MDLALSTVLLFLIISPGLVSRFCYFTHPFSNQARYSEFITEIFWSVIPGLIIHFIFLQSVEFFTKHTISINDVLFLIRGADDNKRLDTIGLNIKNNISNITLYFITLLAF